MTVEHHNYGTVYTGDSITMFRLVAQRAAVKLEAKGYKHSNGNITPKLKKHYNLPHNATAYEVVAKINEEINALASSSTTVEEA